MANNPSKHAILKVQQYEPQEFATHIVANIENMWGILKALVALFMEKPDGKYILMKEPNEVCFFLLFHNFLLLTPFIYRIFYFFTNSLLVLVSRAIE